MEEHNLRGRNPGRLALITGQGFLGQTRGELARLQTLKLGQYTLTNVFAELETNTNAARGSIAGFIGGPVLRKR